MKKYVKNLSWTQRLIIIFAVIVAGFYFYFSTGSLPFQKNAVTVNVQKTKDGEKVIRIEDVNTSAVNKEFPNDMTEDEVMTTIHKMSHQKVVANKKWGAIPLTPERVNRLLKVVQENYKDYEGSSIYIDILERWSNGNFSRVDEDHNKVWELQGGTVGEAMGIASPEEERVFIEKNFKIKQ